jgi:lipoprotein-anchoring transpeptidase ErfK/SrfK
LLGGLEAVTSGVEVEPRLLVDLNQSRTRLTEVRAIVEEPARNAGIQLVNGAVQTTAPVQGRVLDLDATLATLQNDAAAELADGALDLRMVTVAPSVTDATPLLQQAQALLSSPLTIEAFDPVNGETQVWSLTPQEWSQWLVASPDQSSTLGLRLSLHDSGLRQFLDNRSAQLPNAGYLEINESIEKVNAALQNNQLSTWVRVYHTPSSYTVQGGDTLASIGYQTGIPYPWIQSANPGVNALSPGQQITLPSKDDLLPLPVVRNKRIVVSIPAQELWAYEDGQLVYNWTISTGIARSPTAPGIFQIQSHDPNAYAAQWNLYMPHFMGVYEPGPNAGVMNGFHGFPTDATGGYLLWTSNLGRPATYGCILLSLDNAAVLYDWAQEGVVVEITG